MDMRLIEFVEAIARVADKAMETKKPARNTSDMDSEYSADTN